MNVRTIKQAIENAHKADEAFGAACHAAGFKTRWDWNQHTTPGPEFLREAYRAKVTADNAMHAAFEASSTPWLTSRAKRRITLKPIER